MEVILRMSQPEGKSRKMTIYVGNVSKTKKFQLNISIIK